MTRLGRAWGWVVAYLVPRWCYQLHWRVRHFKSWRAQVAYDKLRPPVGGMAHYHGEGPYRVVAVDGDDLTLVKPDGSTFEASWSNCCEPA